MWNELSMILCGRLFWEYRLTLVLGCGLWYLYSRRSGPVKSAPDSIAGKREVPLVSGGLPFIGHGYEFSKDMIGFLLKCCQTYGNVFKLKIFRVELVVVADRNMCKPFFSAPEETLSLNDVLERLYFEDAFSDERKFMDTVIHLLKKSVAISFNEFVPKIQAQAQRMVQILGEKRNLKDTNVSEEFMKFVTCTSAECFMAIPLPDDILKTVLNFSHCFNYTIVATYFFPKWLLRLVVNPWLRRQRYKITRFMEPEIQTYRDNPDKRDSLVIRQAVDFVDEETGKTLSNAKVGDLIVCLLYVSSANTSLGLTSAITEIVNNNYAGRLREECRDYLDKGDFRGLLTSKLLDACVMEAARINSHVFALNRKPRRADFCLGDYHIGKVECLALCESLLMVHGPEAEAVFSDAQTFNPERFLNGESTSASKVMTWGAGVHLCPGKTFALYEIKIAVALLLTKFDIQMESCSPKNYFSPSAFAERTIRASLYPL